VPVEDFSIGVEEEFSIVDRATGELRPRAQRVLEEAERFLGDEVEAELNLSQVETGTPVCTTLAEVRAEVRRLRRHVLAAAERTGSTVVATGSHPTAHWQDQAVNPGKERYRHLEDEFRLTAWEQLVSGCHVHVGIADPELAIAVLNRSRLWLSPVLALSANSPFWMGVDSGYASYRSQVWAHWPLTGMPEPLRSRAEYDRLIDDLVAVGAIRDASFLYWDVRPSARYRTLEFRVADACLTVDDVVMVAGLIRSLARTCAAEARGELPLPAVRGELVGAAKWRASRYGLDGTLVDLASCRARPAAEVVGALLDHLRPDLEDHGEWDEVRSLVDQTLARGNGATRQREAFARTGDLAAVVDLLVAETASGLQPA
jgi:carboxylate-amine ligase